MKDFLQLHECLSYRPFRPFWLETIAGTRIKIEKAEWFLELVDAPDRFIVLHSGFVTFGHFSELTDLIQMEDPK